MVTFNNVLEFNMACDKVVTGYNNLDVSLTALKTASIDFKKDSNNLQYRTTLQNTVSNVDYNYQVLLSDIGNRLNILANTSDASIDIVNDNKTIITSILTSYTIDKFSNIFYNILNLLKNTQSSQDNTTISTQT